MLVIQIKVELWPLIKNSSLSFPYVLPKLGTVEEILNNGWEDSK